MSTVEEILDLGRKDGLGGATSPAFLRLNFRNVSLRTVLNYLHDTAELPIEVESNVEIGCELDLWHEELVNKQEAIMLLQRAVEPKGYRAIYKQGMLAIVRSQDAKKHCIPLPKFSCSALAA